MSLVWEPRAEAGDVFRSSCCFAAALGMDCLPTPAQLMSPEHYGPSFLSQTQIEDQRHFGALLLSFVCLQPLFTSSSCRTGAAHMVQPL